MASVPEPSFSFRLTDAEPIEASRTDFFYEDDFLLHLEVEGGTARLYCMIGYGNDPTEITFMGVSFLKSTYEDFNAAAPLDVSGSRFKRVDDLNQLVIEEETETRVDEKRIKWESSPLLEITYKQAFMRDCEVICTSGKEYTKPRQREVTRNEGLLWIAGVMVFALLYVLYEVSVN